MTVGKRYEYLCQNGHSSSAPFEMEKCPIAYCRAPLRRVGEGSRPRIRKDSHPEMEVRK